MKCRPRAERYRDVGWASRRVEAQGDRHTPGMPPIKGRFREARGRTRSACVVLIAAEHLDHNRIGRIRLEQFTFRLNRRTSTSRGLLFYRLLQQATNTDPAPLKDPSSRTACESGAGSPRPLPRCFTSGGRQVT